MSVGCVPEAIWGWEQLTLRALVVPHSPSPSHTSPTTIPRSCGPCRQLGRLRCTEHWLGGVGTRQIGGSQVRPMLHSEHSGGPFGTWRRSWTQSPCSASAQLKDDSGPHAEPRSTAAAPPLKKLSSCHVRRRVVVLLARTAGG